jgi:hypothetical protein
MPDVTVTPAAPIRQTIYLLQPNTQAGRDWIDQNIGPDNGYQPWYPTVVCEHRYLADIVAGMREAGLEVE